MTGLRDGKELQGMSLDLETKPLSIGQFKHPLDGLVIQGIDSIQGELIEVGNLARRYKGLMTSNII